MKAFLVVKFAEKRRSIRSLIMGHFNTLTSLCIKGRRFKFYMVANPGDRSYRFHMHYLSRIMRKPAFCICEKKNAGNRTADQRRCIRCIDSTIPLLPKSELSSLSSSSVAVQTGLCRTWSETPKTGIVMTRLNFEQYQSRNKEQLLLQICLKIPMLYRKYIPNDYVFRIPYLSYCGTMEHCHSSILNALKCYNMHRLDAFSQYLPFAEKQWRIL